MLTYNISTWTKTVKINRGERDGVADDMPLISPEGMVGRVIRTSKRSAEALLITDPRSSIDVMLQRTRVRAVAEGDGSGGLILKYIRDLEDIRIGDKVVTAGLSGIFPRKASDRCSNKGGSRLRTTSLNASSSSLTPTY